MPSGRPWQSNVPGAIAQLLTLIEAQVASAGAKVLVKDGQWASEESGKDVIVVGWPGFYPGYEYPSRSMSEELGGASVTVTTVQSGLGPAYLETFRINCASVVRVGAGSIASARTIAYANITLVGKTIDDLIRTPPVAKATMAADSALHQVQTRRGIDVIVTFGIECEAWTQ
jgi:hypothetical protein